MIKRHLTLLCSMLMLLVVSCGSSPVGGSYTRLIPDNYLMLSSVNIANLETAADLTPEQLKLLNDILFLAEDETKQLKAFDQSAPMYVFLANDGNAGFVTKVADKSLVKDILKDVIDVKKITSKDGYEFYSDSDISLAFNSNEFIVLTNIDGYANMINANITPVEAKVRLEALLAGDNDFASTSAASYIKENDQITFSYNTEGMDLPISYITNSNLNFEKGRLVSLTKSSISGDKKLMSAVESLTKKPSGTFNKYIASDYLLYLSLAINGKGDVETLFDFIIDYSESMSKMATPNQFNSQQIAMLKEYESTVCEVLSTINGDFTMAVTGMNMIPDVFIGMEVTDTKALDMLVEALNDNGLGSMVTKTAENQYSINYIFITAYFGVVDGKMYITNSNTTYQALVNDKALDNNFNSAEIASLFKGSYGGLVIDAERTMQHPTVKQYLQAEIGSDIPVLDDVTTITTINKTQYEAEIIVNIKDKKRNALNLILDEVLKAAQ